MFTRIVNYMKRKHEEWERCCTRCGLCCYEKDVEPNGDISINLDAPCPHLDTATGLCRVYDTRFRVCKECRKVRMYHALFSRYMPATCGYVQRYRKWNTRPPVLKRSR